MVLDSANQTSRWQSLVLPVVIFSIVAAAVIWAISVVGTPNTARQKELDNIRVGDLRRVHYAVDRYYQKNKALPAKLSDLDLSKSDLLDPATEAPYGYVVVDSKNYKLVANFTYASSQNETFSVDKKWLHPAGEFQFSFEAPPPKPGS